MYSRKLSALPEEKSKLEAQPSKKKEGAPPVVKHTITSTMRIQLAQQKKTGTDSTRKSKPARKPAGFVVNRRQSQYQTKPKPRKSLKPTNLNRKKSLSANQIEPKLDKPGIDVFQSMENLYWPTQREFNYFANLGKEGAERNLFKSPSSYKRRSLHQELKVSNSGFLIGDRQLSKWLKFKEQQAGEYHHLSQMIKMAFEEETTIAEEVIPQLARGAAHDLIRLLDQGYPVNECADLADLITFLYEKIVESHEYWELRAQIATVKGNLTEAVEYSRAAIVQGAKVTSVNKSLDFILENFSSINVGTTIESRTEKEIDERSIARNTFRRRIIRSSIRERDAKKKLQLEAASGGAPASTHTEGPQNGSGDDGEQH